MFFFFCYRCNDIKTTFHARGGKNSLVLALRGLLFEDPSTLLIPIAAVPSSKSCESAELTAPMEGLPWGLPTLIGARVVWSSDIDLTLCEDLAFAADIPLSSCRQNNGQTHTSTCATGFNAKQNNALKSPSSSGLLLIISRVEKCELSLKTILRALLLCSVRYCKRGSLVCTLWLSQWRAFIPLHLYLLQSESFHFFSPSFI